MTVLLNSLVLALVVFVEIAALVLGALLAITTVAWLVERHEERKQREFDEVRQAVHDLTRRAA